MKNALLLGAISALAVSTSGAVVVWTDDFTDARASAPNPYDYAGGAVGNDYLMNANGNTFAVSGGVLNIADTVSVSSTSDALLAVPTSQWSARPTTNGDIVRFSYSIRVNSLTGGGASVPRFSILQNAANDTGALGGGGTLFTIGFGHGAFADGDTSNSDLGFYTSQDLATPPGTGATAPIGLSGGVWADGFDFGNYDAPGAVAADRDTHDQFYRVVITMTEGSNEVTGSITNETTPSQTTTFSANALAALNFKNTDLVDAFRIATGQGGTSNTDFDNIVVEILPIPEPSSALLAAACGALGLLRRRRA